MTTLMTITRIYDDGVIHDSATRVEGDFEWLANDRLEAAIDRVRDRVVQGVAIEGEGTVEIALTLTYPAEHHTGLVTEVYRFAPAPVSEAEVVTSLDGALTDDRARLTGEATA